MLEKYINIFIYLKKDQILYYILVVFEDPVHFSWLDY